MELIKTAGGWAHTDVPRECPNGHPLRPRTVFVSWLPCACRDGISGHRCYQCAQCGETVYRPEHR